MNRARYVGRNVKLPCPHQAQHFPFRCSPAWNLSQPHTFGILGKLHQVGMIDHQPYFQLSSSLKGMRSRAKNAKLIIMAWSFWLHPSSRNPIQSCLVRTKDTPITQAITKVSGVLCEQARAETYMYFPLSHGSRLCVNIKSSCALSLPLSLLLEGIMRAGNNPLLFLYSQ